jgi:hypothetical protein
MRTVDVGHPSVYVAALRAVGKVDDQWAEAYRHCLMETGEVAVAQVDDGDDVASLVSDSKPF